jgi:stage V sporulation protein AE
MRFDMDVFYMFLKSFLVGGAICALGQLLIDKTRLTSARILTMFVISGVVLGAVGVYEPFIEWAGAGASVPLIGFGNVLAQGVKKAVEENGLIGAFTGGLTSGAAGIASAIFFGVIVALLVRLKDKN